MSKKKNKRKPSGKPGGAGRSGRPANHTDMSGSRAGGDAIANQYNYGVGPARGAAQTLIELPAVDAGFTSRTEELGRVLAVIDPEEENSPGVVVSQGMGGVGKTQLALAAGHEAIRRGWFAGALFVDLHGYTTPVDGDRAVESFLHSLEVPAERWPEDPEARRGLYRSALENRAQELGGPILVVADNASEAKQLKPLVPAQSRHRLLATSRDRLTSLGWRRIAIDHLPDDRAVPLLVEALKASEPDDPRAAEAIALARVAKACGGLPLALRISAAVLGAAPDMTVTELADTLEEAEARLFRLKDDSRSLHAVFEQSRTRLDRDVAEMLTLLGLAPGPDISTAAAAALAGISKPEVLERLRALSSAHFVSEKAGRWRMHDLTADYANSLSTGNNTPSRYPRAQRRLFGYYTSMARDARSHLAALPGDELPDTFADHKTALQWLDNERVVLINTVHLALGVGNVETQHDLPQWLGEYLDKRRDFSDLEELRRIGLNAAKRARQPRLEAGAWDNLGLVLQDVRRFEEAIDAHQRAQNMHQQSGDTHHEANAWNNLGLALQEIRRFEEAIDAHQRAQTMFQQLGDPHHEAKAWNNLGLVLREVRRFEEAIDAHQRDLAICQQLGDTHQEAMAWNNLGMALRDAERTDEAAVPFDRAIDYFYGARDLHSEGQARYELGLNWVAAKNPEKAISELERAVELLGANNDPYLHGKAIESLDSARNSLNSGEDSTENPTP